MAFLVHGRTAPESDAIVAALRRLIDDEGRVGDAFEMRGDPEECQKRGINSLPAVILLRRPPNDYEILFAGSVPTDHHLAMWVADLPPKPRSLLVAAAMVVAKIAPDTRRGLATKTRGEFVAHGHYSPGTFIRNSWLLHNPRLLASCGTKDPDTASSRIFEEAWQILQLVSGAS